MVDVSIVLALLLVAYAVWRLAEALERRRREAEVQQMLALFGPVAATHDPKQLLAWLPIAKASRSVCPGAFGDLDKAFGGVFPFTKAHIEAAHARCTSDWLAWERAHDAEYSLKAAQVEDEMARAGGPPSALLRTRLAAVEQQKLERYQQRYEEYIKTAKGLAAYM